MLLILGACAMGACHQPAGGTGTTDTTKNRTLPPAVDNSQATNPSVADTAYPEKDTMITQGDSARSKK